MHARTWMLLLVDYSAGCNGTLCGLVRAGLFTQMKSWPTKYGDSGLWWRKRMKKPGRGHC